MTEELIHVDLDDNVIGYGEKLETHRSPILHRAFSVFLYNGDKMLLQVRHPKKYHSGGLYANSCCSHPRRGETLPQAVSRRLEQELGIQAEAEEQFSFIYCTAFPNGLYEYEYDHVFLGEYSGEVPFDKEEIDRVEWISLSELKRMLVESPALFSSWFLIAAPRVLRILAERGIV